MAHNVFDIDDERLDQEAAEIPRLIRKYSKLLADAQLKLTQAENALELVEAELKLKIRRNPSLYEINEDKPPMELVKAAMIRTKKYQDAKLAIAKAKHELDVHRSAVSSLQAKKQKIADMTELHKTNYFSEPRVADREHRRMSEKSACRGLKRGGD